MRSTNEILNSHSTSSKPFESQYNSREWSRFSSGVISRCGQCQVCRTSKGLNVHHPFYDYTRKLWEYADDELVVLCQSCHKEMHKELQVFRKHVFGLMTPTILRHINECLHSGLTRYNKLDYTMALIEFTKNERLVTNHARVAAL